MATLDLLDRRVLQELVVRQDILALLGRREPWVQEAHRVSSGLRERKAFQGRKEKEGRKVLALLAHRGLLGLLERGSSNMSLALL